jgi:hypothetical protein
VVYETGEEIQLLHPLQLSSPVNDLEDMNLPFIFFESNNLLDMRLLVLCPLSFYFTA